jgi:prephenate dehydrogenase
VSFGVPLGIAGVGLIGGSIALRAKARGVPVIGFDTNPSIADLVDKRASSLDELACEARTLVIALPVDVTIRAIEELREGDYPNLELVLDVASVKMPVVARARGWSRFVATHPIAGNERSGPQAAPADLFEDRVWTYVPSNAQRDAKIEAFIAAMGARAFRIDPETHDRTLALTSHLPQAVVCALAAMLVERDIPRELAGSGLASTLRLSGSPWEIWEPILRSNGPAIAEALRELSKRLEGLAEDVEAGTLRLAASYFKSARAAYDAFVKPRH